MELYNKEFVYFEWDKKLDGKKGFVAQNIESLKGQVNNNPKGMVTLSGSNDDVCPFTYFCDGEITCDYVFAYYDPYYEFRKAYLEGKQLQFKNDKGGWEDIPDGFPPLFTTDEYRIKPDDIIWKVVLSDDCALGIAKTTDKHVYFTGNEEECNEWINEHNNFTDIMWAWEREKKPIQFYDDRCKKWRNCNDFDGKPCEPNWGVGTEYRIKPENTYVPFDSVQELIDAWERKSGIKFNHELTMPQIWIKRKDTNEVYLITEFMFENDDSDGDWDVGTSYENLELKELLDYFTFLDGSIIGKVKEVICYDSIL